MRNFLKIILYSALQFIFCAVLALRSTFRATGGSQGDFLDVVGVLLRLPLGILPWAYIVFPINSFIWGVGLFYFWRCANQKPRFWWPKIVLKSATWLLFLSIAFEILSDCLLASGPYETLTVDRKTGTVKLLHPQTNHLAQPIAPANASEPRR